MVCFYGTKGRFCNFLFRTCVVQTNKPDCYPMTMRRVVAVNHRIECG